MEHLPRLHLSLGSLSQAQSLFPGMPSGFDIGVCDLLVPRQRAQVPKERAASDKEGFGGIADGVHRLSCRERVRVQPIW